MTFTEQTNEDLAQFRSLDFERNYPRIASLSEREFTVFMWLARGLPNKNIAENLMLSIKTVSTYRARILVKTALGSNLDMANLAWQTNLIQREAL